MLHQTQLARSAAVDRRVAAPRNAFQTGKLRVAGVQQLSKRVVPVVVCQGANEGTICG
jgi:hypothetical protein